VATTEDAKQPEPGTDSRVEDWFGQSVERDAELADRLVDELGDQEAEAVFDELATGEAQQDARHGDEIDPDQGRSAYQDPVT
jgi:hypothetical protein